MLMALGLFAFELATLPFSEMQRHEDWRHPGSERIGARDAVQFTGPGEDRVTLTGMCVPEVGGNYDSIDQLRAMADTGEAWPLVEGTGRILGNFVVTGLDTRRQHFIDNGVARTTDFAIDLKRVAD